MNELERLIAASSRPEPSTELDARVSALLASELPRRSRPRRQAALVLCATSACMGLIGFVFGRQSVSSMPQPPAITSAAPAPHGLNEAAPVSVNVTQVPLRDDQLAGLFLRPGAREGMLGKGPVTIEISTSP